MILWLIVNYFTGVLPLVMPIGDDLIENQRAREETINEIKENLEQKKIRKN